MPNPIDNKPDVLPKISYAQCGFSPVEGDLVSVFASYFDESGTHNKKFLVVAGFTAEIDKWAEFSRQWNAILAEHELAHFHMKEFRSKKSKPFASLSAHGKAALLTDLLEVIANTALFGMFSILSPAHYDALTTPKFRSDFGAAFSLVASGAASCSVAQVQKIRPGNNRVGIFFEEGHKNIGQALDLIRYRKKELEELDTVGFGQVVVLPGADKHLHPPDDPIRKNTAKIGAIGSGSKADMPPLQAADILAYCVYSELVSNEVGFCKAVIDTIDSSVPLYSSHLYPETIAKMVEGTLNAEREWRQFKKDAFCFSKEVRKEGVEVMPHEDGLRIRSSKPIPEELQHKLRSLMQNEKV